MFYSKVRTNRYRLFCGFVYLEYFKYNGKFRLKYTPISKYDEPLMRQIKKHFGEAEVKLLNNYIRLTGSSKKEALNYIFETVLGDFNSISYSMIKKYILQLPATGDEFRVYVDLKEWGLKFKAVGRSGSQGEIYHINIDKSDGFCWTIITRFIEIYTKASDEIKSLLRKGFNDNEVLLFTIDGYGEKFRFINTDYSMFNYLFLREIIEIRPVRPTEHMLYFDELKVNDVYINELVSSKSSLIDLDEV